MQRVFSPSSSASVLEAERNGVGKGVGGLKHLKCDCNCTVRHRRRVSGGGACVRRCRLVLVSLPRFYAPIHSHPYVTCVLLILFFPPPSVLFLETSRLLKQTQKTISARHATGAVRASTDANRATEGTQDGPFFVSFFSLFKLCLCVKVLMSSPVAHMRAFSVGEPIVLCVSHACELSWGLHQ